MTERDERALRDALQELGSDEPVDLGRVRRRAAERRRNARAVAGLAVALVVVAGVVGLPRLIAPGGDQPSSMAGGAQAEPESRTQEDNGGTQPEAGPPGRRVAPTPTASARRGWRTEYFRDVSFSVPATWGYAVPPQSDWCANDPPGEPRADQLRPYVWLDGDVLVRRIACGSEPPTSLLTEHVEALSPRPAVDHVEGTVRQGEWWVVTRFVGSAVLVVTTKDRDRADSILDSARVVDDGTLCSPRSPIAGPLGARPDDGVDLGRLGSVDQVVLCQYQPVTDPGDADLPRLRAALRLDRAAGRKLVDALGAAPVNDATCDPAPVDERPDLAVLVRIRSGGRTYEVFVNPAGCPDGPGMSGGIDDGTTVRVLTRDACRQVLTPPLAIWAGIGDVGRNCQR
jgi:hypothetical protein